LPISEEKSTNAQKEYISPDLSYRRRNPKIEGREREGKEIGNAVCRDSTLECRSSGTPTRPGREKKSARKKNIK